MDGMEKFAFDSAMVYSYIVNLKKHHNGDLEVYDIPNYGTTAETLHTRIKSGSNIATPKRLKQLEDTGMAVAVAPNRFRAIFYFTDEERANQVRKAVIGGGVFLNKEDGMPILK